MARKKRKRNEFVQALVPPLALGGVAIGSAVLGQGFDKVLPSGFSNPLTTTATTLGMFVAPVAIVSVGALAIKQVQKIQPKKKKRRK